MQLHSQHDGGQQTQDRDQDTDLANESKTPGCRHTGDCTGRIRRIGRSLIPRDGDRLLLFRFGDQFGLVRFAEAVEFQFVLLIQIS